MSAIVMESPYAQGQGPQPRSGAPSTGCLRGLSSAAVLLHLAEPHCMTVAHNCTASLCAAGLVPQGQRGAAQAGVPRGSTAGTTGHTKGKA